MIVASGAATNALIGFAEVGGDTRRGRARAARSGPLARDRAAARDRRCRTARPTASTGRSSFLRASGHDLRPGNVRLRPLRLPAAAERDALDERARGGLGCDPGRRPGSRLGALVPGRRRCHAAARRPRRWHAVARPSRAARRHAPAASSTSSAPAALDRPLRDFELDPVTDHAQRPTRRARMRFSSGRSGGAAGREAIGERGRPPGGGGRGRAPEPVAGRRRDPRRVDRGGGRRPPARPPELNRVHARPSRSP